MVNLGKVSVAFGLYVAGHTVAAAEWKNSCQDSAKRNLIAASFQDAVMFAKSAQLMLNTRSSEDGVKNILRIVFGEGEGADKELSMAKEHIDGVAKFSDTDSETIANSNEHAMVLCSADGRYEYNQDKKQWWDKFQAQWTSEEVKQDMETSCYGDTDEDTFAMTGTSGDFRGMDYFWAVRAWQPGKPYPRKKDYVVMRTAVPNTIDTCNVYLKKSMSLPRLSKEELGKIASPDFKLEKDLNKADFLLRQPAATFLHELTHTVTGGMSGDIPMGEGYTWVNAAKAAGGHAFGHNADTVTLLCLGLWAYDNGYAFTEAGDLVKL